MLYTNEASTVCTPTATSVAPMTVGRSTAAPSAGDQPA
jgi:hypothetical protein